MKPDQVSLAIGKGGFNIKLAGKLTGYEIDVYRDSDSESEDVDLTEFVDEIDQKYIKKHRICDDLIVGVVQFQQKLQRVQV